MKRKKSQRRKVRPTILVQWTKNDPNGKERFDRACEIEGAAPATVARALCDKWAELVLGKEKSDIERAAEAAKIKKK